MRNTYSLKLLSLPTVFNQIIASLVLSSSVKILDLLPAWLMNRITHEAKKESIA